MFTGIIFQLGTIHARTPKMGGELLQIQAPEDFFTDIKMGESVALNGCCLTVIGWQAPFVSFEVSAETLNKTTFGQLQVGQKINLEKALKLSDRLGGHFVLGHVDGVGEIILVTPVGGFFELAVVFPKKFRKWIIEKGSVTIDGISLTVCDLTLESFKVALIPHTMQQTHLHAQKFPLKVNLEFDVLGKYALGVVDS